MFSQVSHQPEEVTTMSASSTDRRELAHRASNGIDVWLYWEIVGDTLSLEVYDSKDDEYYEIDVPKDRAMDAFRHPFVYLAAAQARETAELLAA
jgi:hypothetical protein